VVVFQKHWPERAMAARTIELDRKDLNKSIEVLSSATQALRLTRLETLSYRALMLTVDVGTVLIAAAFAYGLIVRTWIMQVPLLEEFGPWFILLVLSVFLVVGLVSLVLNIPLFVRVLRERSRLKKLGLSSLSRSLWIESRRSRWISRARDYLLIGVGIFIVLRSAYYFLIQWKSGYINVWDLITITVMVLIISPLILEARYLRNQRERIDLAANAEELRQVFQSLRQRAGKTEVVSVPTELVERTAKIESAQIAKERKDAILESVTSRPTGYAIAFDRDAAEQRATLDVADRIELADLVAQLSIAGMQLQSREGIQRDKTESNRVEIDYVTDTASRSKSFSGGRV
jgi:hypothetical protein